MQENKKYFVGGLVAGEGHFGYGIYGKNKQPRFRFSVQVADDDVELIDIVKTVLGVGTIFQYPPRKSTEKGVIAITVQSIDVLCETVIPFFDKYLIGTRKREQYEAWKIKLLEYQNIRIGRKNEILNRRCLTKKCIMPYRARGYCNSHYESRRRKGEFR